MDLDGAELRGEDGVGGGRERSGGELEDEDGGGGERRRRVWREEGGGEGVGGGLEEVVEALVDGHLVDEAVDVGDVGGGGEADAGVEGGGGGSHGERCF